MANHCTMYPEGTWSSCCARHDKRYENTRLTRAQADELLFRCVKRTSNVFNAYIMWVGVRLGGWYFKKD